MTSSASGSSVGSGAQPFRTAQAAADEGLTFREILASVPLDPLSIFAMVLMAVALGVAEAFAALPAAALQLQHRWKTAQGRFPAQIVSYELAGGGGHFHRACLVSDKANRRRYQFLVREGDLVMRARFPSNSASSLLGKQDRASHRHGFQNFVLYPASDLQRSKNQIG